jgi:two-component system sensor histidine kinase PhoQ
VSRRLSLQARLLLAALLVLPAFIGLTGLALDKAFRESAESALQNRLQGYLFALLAAVEVDAAGRPRFSRILPEARFSRPGSGLYARVVREDGQARLNSPSLLGLRLPPPPAIPLATFRYQTLDLDGRPHSQLSYAIRWELDAQRSVRFTFQVIEDMQAYYQQINRYRRSLWSWLAGAALLLLLVQAVILRWGLQPLRKVARELERIEQGEAEQLAGDYPKELQQLTDRINDLLQHTRRQLARYRDALGNLAHSLKTPLAILNNTLSLQQVEPAVRQEAGEQLQRIQQIIDYQLQRAATAGQTSLQAAIEVAPLARQVIEALRKVFADKNLQIETTIPADLACHCDRGDLMEILGNLLENACKWARHTVHIAARQADDGRVILRIEDDGPGIPAEVRERVRRRGERADAGTPGHGLGLAMVQEIVLLYGGQMHIDRSELGGAAIEVHLP